MGVKRGSAVSSKPVNAKKLKGTAVSSMAAELENHPCVLFVVDAARVLATEFKDWVSLGARVLMHCCRSCFKG